jgi:hypothetical protein
VTSVMGSGSLLGGLGLEGSALWRFGAGTETPMHRGGVHFEYRIQGAIHKL